MNDRTLLEAAAKAAGYDHRTDPYHPGRVFIRHAGHEWQYFDPLRDDGDALRLAVKLNITIGFDALPDGAIVYASAEWHQEWDRGFRIMEWLGKDAHAATRRAIVRAAAAIGEQR